MFFSKSCEYGLRALMFLSNHSKRVKISEICEGIHSPKPFTAKVMQALVRTGYVISAKGPDGGFSLKTKNLSSINLADIVKVFDGESLNAGCVLGLQECSNEFPCPLHYKFLAIRAEVNQMLEECDLKTVVDLISKNRVYLRSE